MPDRSSLPVLSNLLGQFAMSPSVQPMSPSVQPSVQELTACRAEAQALLAGLTGKLPADSFAPPP